MLATLAGSGHDRFALLTLARIGVVALLVLVAAWPGAASTSREAAVPTGRILYVYDASGSSGPLLTAVAEADLDRGAAGAC